MEIEQIKNENGLIVTPHGRLDSATSGEFADSIDRGFTDDCKTLVINFEDVDFISSKGLRVIVSAYKNLNGRKMEIIGANPAVLDVLRLSGLMKVIDVK